MVNIITPEHNIEEFNNTDVSWDNFLNNSVIFDDDISNVGLDLELDWNGSFYDDYLDQPMTQEELDVNTPPPTELSFEDLMDPPPLIRLTNHHNPLEINENINNPIVAEPINIIHYILPDE